MAEDQEFNWEEVSSEVTSDVEKKNPIGNEQSTQLESQDGQSISLESDSVGQSTLQDDKDKGVKYYTKTDKSGKTTYWKQDKWGEKPITKTTYDFENKKQVEDKVVADAEFTEIVPLDKPGDVDKMLQIDGPPVVMPEQPSEPKTEEPKKEEDLSWFNDIASRFNRSLLGLGSESLKFIGEAASGINKVLGVEPNKKTEDYATYKLGNQVDEFIKDLYPIDPKRDADLSSSIASGLGSMLGFMVAGPTRTAFFGAASQAAPEYDKTKQIVTDANELTLDDFINKYTDPSADELSKNEIDKSLELQWMDLKGKNPDDVAFKSFVANALIGSSEALPINMAFGRMFKNGSSRLKDAAVSAISGGTEEAFQEGMTQYLSNLTTKELLDENKNLLDDVAKASGTAFILGGTLNASITALTNNYEKAEGEGKVKIKEQLDRANELKSRLPEDGNKTVLTLGSKEELQNEVNEFESKVNTHNGYVSNISNPDNLSKIASSISVDGGKLVEEFVNDVDSKVQQGYISTEQGEQAKQSLKTLLQANDKVPNSITDIEKRGQAVKLVAEKSLLEEEIKDKDKALSAPQIERIKQINEELTNIALGKEIQPVTEQAVATEGEVQTQEPTPSSPEISLDDKKRNDIIQRLENAKAGPTEAETLLSSGGNWKSIIEKGGNDVYNKVIDYLISEIKEQSTLGKAVQKTIEYIDGFMGNVAYDKQAIEDELNKMAQEEKQKKVVKESKKIPQSLKKAQDWAFAEGRFAGAIEQAKFDAKESAKESKKINKEFDKERKAASKESQKLVDMAYDFGFAEGSEAGKLEQASKDYKEFEKEKKKLSKQEQERIDRAYSIGKTDGSRKGYEMVDVAKILKDYIENNKEYVEYINKSKAAKTALMKKLNKLMESTESSQSVRNKRLNELLDYMDKLAEDGKYQDKLNEAYKNIKGAHKKKHSADIYPLVKEFLGINIKKLTTSELENYLSVVEELNQTVPNYSELNKYKDLINKYNQSEVKKYNESKVKSSLEELITVLSSANPNDVDEYKNIMRKVNQLKTRANQLREIEIGNANDLGIDADTEQLDELIDSINLFKTKTDDVYKQFVEPLKNSLIKDAKSYKPDTSTMSDSEIELLDRFNRLSDDDLKRLDVSDLDILSDIMDRTEQGYVPVYQMNEVLSTAEAKKSAPEVDEQLSKVSEDKTTNVSDELFRNRLASIEMSFIERALGIKEGALSTRIISPLIRSLTESKKSVSKAIEKYHKNSMNKVLGVGIRPNSYSRNKVGMIMHIVMDASNKKQRGVGNQIADRDWFGVVLAKPEAVRRAIPQLLSEVEYQELGTDEQRFQKAMEKANNMSSNYSSEQKKLLNKAYNELLSKYNDGSGQLDINKIKNDIELNPEKVLSKEEVRLYNASREALNDLTGKQKFANEVRGIEFNPVENYIKRSRKGRQIELTVPSGSGGNNATIRSQSGQERLTDNIGAVETDVEKLIIESIVDTERDYNMTKSLRYTNKVFDELKTGKSNYDLITKLRGHMRDRINYEYSRSAAGELYSNLIKAKITKSLASIPRTIAEIAGTLASIPMRIAKTSKAGFSTSIPFYKTTPYKAFQKLLEQTNSSLYIKEMSKHIDSEQTGFKPRTKLDKAASVVIAYPEHLLQGLAWIPIFQAKYSELTGNEFDFNEYLNNPKYGKDNVSAIEDAATFADVETKKIIGGGLKSEGRMKVQAIPEKLDKTLFGVPSYIDANSRAGKTLSLLGNYMWRENYEMMNGLKDVAKGDTFTDKVKGGGKAFGIMTNMVVYSLTRAYIDAMIAMDIGNDEEKEKARQLLKQFKTGDYYKNMLSSQLATSMASKYGQVGRESVFAVLNYYYNQIEDVNEREAFGKYIEDNFYKKPIKAGYGAAGKVAEEGFKVLLPDLHYLTSNVLNIMQGSKNEMGIGEFSDKLQEGEILDEDKFRLFNMFITAINIGALASGQAVPKDIMLVAEKMFGKEKTSSGDYEQIEELQLGDVIIEEQSIEEQPTEQPK